jgi:hypothetical protein
MHRPRVRHYKSTVIEDYGIISVINIQGSMSKTNMYIKWQYISIQMTIE